MSTDNEPTLTVIWMADGRPMSPTGREWAMRSMQIYGYLADRVTR